MHRPAKTTINPKNRPDQFRELLTMAAPRRTTAAVPALPKPSFRAMLWVIWALATIAAGVGFGQLIRESRATDLTAEPGTPVAEATIKPAAVTTGDIARPAATATQPTLKVEPATSVQQAQAGTPAASMSAATLQGASDPDSLQPGFSTTVHVQGNIGTQPVK